MFFSHHRMIPFKDITIDDADKIGRLLKMSNIPGCDFSFATIFCWLELYKTKFTIQNDFLLLRYHADGLWQYMPPIGNGDLRYTLQTMLDDAAERNEPFAIGACTPELFGPISDAMPEKFFFTEKRDQFEYIYSREKLATLTGKNLQAKRNHINRFIAKYPDFSYEPLNGNCKHECMDLYDAWAAQHQKENPQSDLSFERKSVEKAMLHFEDFGLRGITLRINGKSVAFAFGEKIGDTFIVHTEKTHPDFRDAYAMINKLTAEHLASDCLYINREEDMGIPSLRTAKLQYHPISFLRKGIIRIKKSIRFDIAHATPADNEQIKTLWHDIFGDEMAFIDHFFEKIYQNKHTWVATSDEKIAASAQLLPYTLLTQDGRKLKAAYLFCVMTDKRFRHFGIMEQLLNKAISEQRDNGCDLFFLIPANEYAIKYYEKFGFRQCLGTSASKINGSLPGLGAKTSKSTDEIYNFYCESQIGRSGVLLSETQFTFAYEQLLQEGAEVYENGRCLSIVKGDILVGVIGKSETDENEIYSKIGSNSTLCNLPGMALITNPAIDYGQIGGIRLKFLYEI